MAKKHPQTDKFREQLDNGRLFEQLSIVSHADKRHVGASDLELLERLIEEQRPNNSTFKSEKAYQHFVKESLYNQMDDILKWRDDSDTKDGDTKAFIVDPCGTTIGKGFVKNDKNNTIKEYATHELCLVMKKCSKNRLTGLDIVTAYPDVRGADVTPTGKNLQPIMKQTTAYQKASPTKKAYLLYRADPDSQYLATYKVGDYPGDDVIQIRFPTNNPTTEHNIYLKEDRYRMRTYNNDTAIQTGYTKAHDMVYPPRGYKKETNINVNLYKRELHDLVNKHRPKMIKTTDTIMANIKACSNEQSENTINKTHQDRMKYADQKVAELIPPDNNTMEQSLVQ